jgi:hypothetical protein
VALKNRGMWYAWIWWLCDEDEDFYAHNIILSHLCDPKDWPRPTWRSRTVRRKYGPEEVKAAMKDLKRDNWIVDEYRPADDPGQE